MDNETNKPLKTVDGEDINKKEYTTKQVNGEDGVIKIDGLKITKADKQYSVTIEEEAPSGYMGISAPITFTVATECKDGKTYQLVTKEVDTKIENVEKVKVDSNDILVQIKNVQKEGTYNFNIMKKDEQGTTLRNLKAKFKINFGYWKEGFNTGDFVSCDQYIKSGVDNTKIETNVEVETSRGEIKYNNIIINKNDISKTYYWIIEETEAPTKYIKQDGKIVIPVKFEETDKEFVAKVLTDEACLIKDGNKTDLESTVTAAFNERTNTIELRVTNIQEVEKGSYEIKIKKYGKNAKDNSLKQLNNVEFHLIGGTVNGTKLQGSLGGELSEENYYSILTSSDDATKVWNVPNIARDFINQQDEFILKEMGLDADTGYYNGLTDNININVEKNSTKDGKTITNTVRKVTLKIGNDNQTVSFADGEQTKTITKTLDDGKTIDIKISLQKDTSDENKTVILLEVENPQITGSFNFKLIKKNTVGEKLNNAKFSITIRDVDTNEVIKDSDGNKLENREYTTSNVDGEDGIIKIDGIEIDSQDKRYKVTVKETQAPENYVELEDTIEFIAEATLKDGKNYVLKNSTSSDVVIENNLITVTVINNKSGQFRLVLLKFGQQEIGTPVKIPGGEFLITIKKGEDVLYSSNTPDITDRNGKILINYTKNATNIADNSPITMQEGDKFTITIIETKAPSGYLIPDEYSQENGGKTINLTVVADSNGNPILSMDDKNQTGISVNNTLALVRVQEEAKQEKGKYKIQLIKYGKNLDGTKEQLGGVNFNVIKGKLNGSILSVVEDNKIYNVSKSHPYKIETSATEPAYIWKGNSVSNGTLEIMKSNFVEDDVDSYTLVENAIGSENSKYYIGIKDNIKIDVTRTSKEYDNYVEHSVKSVKLTIGGTTETVDFSNGATTKTITKIVDSQKLDITINLQKQDEETAVITLSVDNPQVNHGKYKINLLKYGKNLDGTRTQIGGVTFGRQVLKKTSTTNETEILSDEIVTNDNSLTSITQGVEEGNGEYVSTNRTGITEKYVLTEKDISQNSKYVIGIDEPIILEVSKKVEFFTENLEPIVTEDSVRSIKLTIGDQTRTINLVTGEGGTQQTITKIVNNQELDISMNVSKDEATNTTTVTLEVENTEKIPGEFNLKLVKKDASNEANRLNNVRFKISIIDTETNKPLVDEYGNEISEKEYTTSTVDGEKGTITINKLNIQNSNKKYHVKVEELADEENGNIVTVDGKRYIISNPVEFDVTSKLNDTGRKYVLDGSTVTNTEQVTVKEEEILIEAKNIPEPVIHKGVKDVQNQDSGYNKNDSHEWVINSTIPYDISKFDKYIITDTIDDRLDFIGETRSDCEGLNSIKVKIVNGRDLVKDVDYRVRYYKNTKKLKITFIEGTFKAGKTLPENSTIEIRFTTKFALNSDGSIKAISQEIPNQASLEYSNGTGEGTKKSEQPEVHTGQVGVYKYNSKTKVALEGAEFKIATSRENAENGNFVKDADGQDLVAISNEKGIAVFTGLEFGEDAINNEKYKTTDPNTKAEVYKYNWEEVKTPYYIVETKSPERFEKYDGIVNVEVRKNLNITEIKDLVSVANRPYEFDLSLRKFITKVVTNEGEENEKVQDVTNRAPDVKTDELVNGTSSTATYNHTKTPVKVFAGDTVIYTIRVYNESEIAGYAEEITDHLPENLEFVDDEFNKQYGWKLDQNDKTFRTVTTDYLSRANNEQENLILEFNKETGEIHYKEIQIKCKVKNGTPVNSKLTNVAEISKYTSKDGIDVTDRDSQPNNVELPKDEDLPNYKDEEIANKQEYIPGQQDDDDFEKVVIQEFDLALRKFITGVTTVDGNKQIVTTRNPIFKIDENGNYVYEHTKEPVLVANQNVVEYTIRVYNEGTINGYAKEVKDDIPEGLEFLPNDEINKTYKWIMLDKEGNLTDDATKAEYITTDYLSKENEKVNGENLISAFDKEKYNSGEITEPDYKEVKVAFKVTIPNTSDKIITNKAQISDHSDEDGNDIKDKDSTPNKWIDGEDDQDIEKIKVQYFDLALRKWVTKAIVTENGQTKITETGHKAEDNPEEVVKVDLKKSKIDSVVVKFEYKTRITNEGQIAGYAKEIKDRIPQGLKFEKEDNNNWTQVEEGIITTDELKDKLLQPGESAEVTVVLTWINSSANMGLKTNVAEISKDYNKYGTPDIDSTPDNNKQGEDDIDDAPVMLALKTGTQELIYIIVTTAVLSVLALGVTVIKSATKENK